SRRGRLQPAMAADGLALYFQPSQGIDFMTRWVAEAAAGMRSGELGAAVRGRLSGDCLLISVIAEGLVGGRLEHPKLYRLVARLSCL
ncbi:MAG TPA: hypothetical protein VFE72_12210, partial [Lysobacter sp.]|nr:hypothetical protein [Lysobacter sp.]